MKNTIIPVFALIVLASISAPATADSLKNLERERALTVRTMLDSTMNVEERWKKLKLSKVRLADLEVMVINDKSLKNSYSNRVKHALSNYELTFLAHASAEYNKSIAAHWFDVIGLNTDQILASRVAK